MRGEGRGGSCPHFSWSRYLTSVAQERGARTGPIICRRWQRKKVSAWHRCEKRVEAASRCAVSRAVSSAEVVASRRMKMRGEAANVRCRRPLKIIANLFKNHAWPRFTYNFDELITDYLQTHCR